MSRQDTVRGYLVLGIILAVFLSSGGAKAAEPYEANWESLARHNEAGEWFRDAKFGIYFHWGVYSVPAYDSEWYPRNMHDKKHRDHQHHVEKYGSPAEFGYDKFVPMFKAEKFDAEEWAKLFKRAGARFAGPVAEHHDGFSMWDSKWTSWDAAEKGPKRDLTGELEKAIRKNGMKFVATFHHARNNLWEIEPGRWEGHYAFAKANYPELLEDPDRTFLYGYMPREKFLSMWKGKLLEVIDNYQPDLIWFDAWLNEIPEKVQMEFLAYYFNRASEWGRDVVVTTKQDMPRSVAVEDFEKGRADKKTDYTWLTDDTLSWGSWCYTEDLKIKQPRTVVHTLVDIVSKNGQLLLNISPKADGTIPDNQRAVLEEMGEWLEINGEAIYATRPWKVYGEGPTQMPKGGHFVGRVDYTERDIRYTRSKDSRTLYAIVLGWPSGKELTLESVDVSGDTGGEVTLLGYAKPLNYSVEQGRITIEVPDLAEQNRPGKYAYPFKLSGFKAAMHPDASSSTPLFEEVLAVPAAIGVHGHRGMPGDIIQLKDGTLLMSYTQDGSIMAVKSKDEGRSWGASSVLIAKPTPPEKGIYCHPSFLRLANEQILLSYIYHTHPTTPYYGHNYYRRSSDEGESWSAQHVMTPHPGYVLVHNDRLLQLSTGRIVAPAEYKAHWPSSKDHNGYVGTAFYSDDNGYSWQVSKNVVDMMPIEVQECHAVELKDKRVMMFARTYSGNPVCAYSSDGCQSWSKGQVMTQLKMPYAGLPTVKRIPVTGDLLFIWISGKSTPTINGQKVSFRCTLTSAISRDEGKTFSHFRNLADDPEDDFGYQSIDFIHPDLAVVSYHARDGLHVARIGVDWFYGK